MAERPSPPRRGAARARGDHPLRQGSEDQDRDDHVQPSGLPQRADVHGAAALCRCAARGQHRQRREGRDHPRRRGQPGKRCGPSGVHGGQRQSGRATGRVAARGRGRGGGGDVPAEGHVPQRGGHHQRLVRQLAGRQSRVAGLQEDQHRRGQGLLLRLALLPVRGCGSGDLLRRRAVRSPVVPLSRLGGSPPDVDLGADDGGAAQVPGDGLHRASVHCSGDVRLQLPQQGGDARRTRGRNPEIRSGLRTEPAGGHRVPAEDVLRDLQAAAGRVHGQPAERVLRVDGQRGSPTTATTTSTCSSRSIPGCPPRSTTTTASSRRSSG